MKRLALLCAVVALVACDDSRGMDTRTYELARLSYDQAQTLLTPYVRSGGTLSGRDRLITVREKPDRLKLIEGILKKYDGGGDVVDVALHLQVVQADGVDGRDSALADIEPILRQTFRYHGYKLVGETQVRVREDGDFEQSVGDFAIKGQVRRMQQVGAEKRLPMQIQLLAPMRIANGVPRRDQMGTTVTTTLGKPMVLGQGTSNGAIILVIRPSLAPM